MAKILILFACLCALQGLESKLSTLLVANVNKYARYHFPSQTHKESSRSSDVHVKYIMKVSNALQQHNQNPIELTRSVAGKYALKMQISNAPKRNNPIEIPRSVVGSYAMKISNAFQQENPKEKRLRNVVGSYKMLISNAPKRKNPIEIPRSVVGSYAMKISNAIQKENPKEERPRTVVGSFNKMQISNAPLQPPIDLSRTDIGSYVMKISNALQEYQLKHTVDKQQDILGKRESELYKFHAITENDHLWWTLINPAKFSIPENDTVFFENWTKVIDLHPFTEIYKSKITIANCSQFHEDSISKLAVSQSQSKFWPFSHEIAVKNQKFALWGLNGAETSNYSKSAFFESLQKRQSIILPYDEKKILYSFNDSLLFLGLNHSGLISNNVEFVSKGLHLFNKTEAEKINEKVDAALELIKKTDPELYKAMNRLVGCIAFYKADKKFYLGGTISSALGVIWLDPSTSVDWSIAMFAEQIVHEYIHTSLFYADMVHGMFSDPSKLSEAKVVSSIRRELRDYDKSLHAAYVSTGLVIFHSQISFFDRAIELAKPLQSSVHDLVVVDEETNILDASGKAVLRSMVDFLTLYGLYC